MQTLLVNGLAVLRISKARKFIVCQIVNASNSFALPPTKLGCIALENSFHLNRKMVNSNKVVLCQ